MTLVSMLSISLLKFSIQSSGWPFEGKEYKIGRHEDDNGAELYIEPQPESDEVYNAIEELFFHDDFHYNTTQAGEEFFTDGEEDEMIFKLWYQ